MRSTIFRTVAALAAVGAVAAPSANAATFTGPSTTTAPYVLPSNANVDTTSLLTVGDSVPKVGGGSYRMVGIPDGLGALPLIGGKMKFFMNHELPNNRGIARRHGKIGSFVSSWSLDKSTKAVESGEDLITSVKYWDYVSQTYKTTPSAGGPNPRVAGDTFPAQPAEFNRFCSASLTDVGALFNKATGNGYKGQIYFGNEEGGDESRLFGVTVDNGKAQQLQRTGLFSWENTLLAPTTNDRTVLLGNEDGGNGQIWLYSGTKTNTGSPFDKAGLTNGTNYVIDAVNAAVTNDAGFRSTYGKNNPAPVTLNSVNWDQSGAKQNADALANGLTLNRIEDGAFDPSNPNDYYFITTSGGATTPNPAEPSISRNGGGLWKLSFNDVNDPSAGATLTLLLDGSEAPYLSAPDNMGIDREGNLLIQEDPGNSAHLARIVAYKISNGKRGVVATFDPAKFTPALPGLLTQDEESSGIIDVSAQLGRGTFLFDAQVHSANADPELVENGQILTLKVRGWNGIYQFN